MLLGKHAGKLCRERYQSCSSRTVQPAPNPEIWLVEPGRSSVPLPLAGRAKQEVHTHHLGCIALLAAVYLSAQIEAFHPQVRFQIVLSLILVPGATASLLSVSHTLEPPPASEQLCTIQNRPLSAIDVELVHLRIRCSPATAPI